MPPPGPAPPPFVPVGYGAAQAVMRLLVGDAAFPSQARPDQPIKLPRQTRVAPEEYKEFINLGEQLWHH